MPQLDISTFLPQLFWLIISFALLYFVLSKYCLPGLSGVFSERNKKISHALAIAEKNKEEAFKLKSEYEAMLAQATKTKDAMISDALKDISKMMDHKIIEHELELKVMVSNSEEKIQNFKKQSEGDIRKIAAKAAKEILANLNVNADEDSVLQAIKGERHV